MAIYRGLGGAGDANSNIEVNELAAIAMEAEQSATNAATSATTSATQATASGASATASANSATASATSATQAANSASSASSSATAAATSATSASTSATNAANSATAAATSASNAATSASNAAAAARSSISVTGAGTYDSTTGVINIQGGVTSVAGRTGAVTLSTGDISGLGTVATESTVPITKGGTGAGTAATARTALGAQTQSKYLDNIATVAASGSGFLVASASSDAVVRRTLTAGTGISITNVDGGLGDPVITNTGVTSVNGATGAVTVSGARGGDTNAVFYENDTSVTANYTLTTGKNAMSAGPITINNGVVVTIPDGSVWTVV